MSKYLFPFFFIILVSGCTVKYQLGLLKTNFDIEKTDLIKGKILSIEFFEDIRIAEEDNEIHFSKKKIYKKDDEKFCINSERRYKTLSYNLTKVSATYMKKSLLFKNVVYGKKEISDYYVTAKLKNYRVVQDFSHEARKDAIKRSVLNASFGLVGGLIAGRPDEFQSFGRLLIELDDVTLYNKKGELIKEIGLVQTKINKDFPADSECWCAYWAAEDNYPDTVEKLLRNIILAIEETETDE